MSLRTSSSTPSRPRTSDIILSVDGVSMIAANMTRIREGLGRMPPGTSFKATILRAGQVLELVGKAP